MCLLKKTGAESGVLIENKTLDNDNRVENNRLEDDSLNQNTPIQHKDEKGKIGQAKPATPTLNNGSTYNQDSPVMNQQSPNFKLIGGYITKKFVLSQN